jgi:hypothetical protein
MTSVTIEGSGGSILIEVIAYENAAASNKSDANWLTSKIKVAAGPFSGEFRATLTTQDFACFDRELIELLRTLQGKATFQTDEEWLRLEIEMGSRGTCVVSGLAKSNDMPETSLKFAFESDQSWLAQTKRAVGEVLESFPVRQSSS